MDLETAIRNLTSFEEYEPRQFHIYLTLYTDSLHVICNRDLNKLLANINSILKRNCIVISNSDGHIETHPVRSLPHRRRLLYRLIERIDLKGVSLEVAKDLHDQLVENLQIEGDVIHILKALLQMYEQIPFNKDRFSLMEIMQTVTFNINHHCERILEDIIDVIIVYFTHEECVSFVDRLFNLSNFGVVEYLVASSLYTTIRQVWQNSYMHKLMRYIMNGFSDNNFAFSASILFETVVDSLEGDMFTCMNMIMKTDLYGPYQNKPRTLNTSFAKYIVPIYAKKQGTHLFNSFADLDLYYRLIICKHIYISRHCFNDRVLLMQLVEEAARCNDRTVSAMGFELLCHFPNMKATVSKYEFEMFKKMLIALPEITTSMKKSIHLFISQVHVCLNYSKHCNTREECILFYEWVQELLHTNVVVKSHFAEIVAEVYCFSLEVLIKPSSYLVTSYTLNRTYTENPVSRILFRQSGKLYLGCLDKVYQTYFDSTSESPVVERVLERLFYQALNESMVANLLHQFLNLLPLSLPWSRNKSLSMAKILLKTLQHIGRLDTIQIIHGIICHRIVEKIAMFIQPRSVSDVEQFDISSHIEILTLMMETTSLFYDYVADCQMICMHLRNVVAIYKTHPKRRYRNHRLLRKAVERSLVAMIHHMYVSAGRAEYPRECVDYLLSTCDFIIDNIPMKKVIVTLSQRLLELLRATHQVHNDVYYEFYQALKGKHMQYGASYNLRKSAGIRNVLHMFLKTLKSPWRFVEDEIGNFLIDAAEPLDQQLLKTNMLECLITDAELKIATRPFIVTIFEWGLRKLDHPDFLVKNAGIQLISSVATRAMGPISEQGVRELAAVDFFMAFPQFARSVSNNLFDERTSLDVKICILGFLAESNSNGHLIWQQCPFDVRTLKRFFDDELLCGPAIKAFIACCPRNKMFDILMEDMTALDFTKENSLYLTNEVELILKLAKIFMTTFPDSQHSKRVTDKLKEVLEVWQSDAFIDRHFYKTISISPLVARTTADLEDNEEALSIANGEQQVNLNYFLGLLRYSNKLADKTRFGCEFHVSFVKELFKFLIGNEDCLELIFESKYVVLNIFNYFNSNIKVTESFFNDLSIGGVADIYIYEIFVVIISQNLTLTRENTEDVNKILDNCADLLLQTQFYNINSVSVSLFLNIIGNITKFVFIADVDVSKFLLILFIITYIVDNEELSKIYHFLTAGCFKTAKSALFVLLNNLELYLGDASVQKHLLKTYLRYISQSQDFNVSLTYLDPSYLTEKIHFQLKLSHNILYLLNS